MQLRHIRRLQQTLRVPESYRQEQYPSDPRLYSGVLGQQGLVAEPDVKRHKGYCLSRYWPYTLITNTEVGGFE
jgi:hypothetical protein